jgi:hypothetical protein
MQLPIGWPPPASMGVEGAGSGREVMVKSEVKKSIDVNGYVGVRVNLKTL